MSLQWTKPSNKPVQNFNRIGFTSTGVRLSCSSGYICSYPRQVYSLQPREAGIISPAGSAANTRRVSHRASRQYFLPTSPSPLYVCVSAFSIESPRCIDCRRSILRPCSRVTPRISHEYRCITSPQRTYVPINPDTLQKLDLFSYAT